MTFDLATFKTSNPTLSLDIVSRLFEEVSAFCKNDVTSMYMSRSEAAGILTKHGVKGFEGLLASCGVECDTCFTPTLLALLQTAACGDKKTFALIIVDVQNDFITGSLVVNTGADVVPVINQLGASFSLVVKTADWHPPDHISFHSNVQAGLYGISERSGVNNADCELFQTVVVEGPPELTQTLWPDHCVQNSTGAEFHPDLRTFPNEVRVEKGMNRSVDSYSGFWDNGDADHTPLYSILLKNGVTDVVVTGIATDYCVGFTALDAARHGFRTLVVNEAIRGVAPETSEAMISRCKGAGVSFISVSELPGILENGDLSGALERIYRAKEHFTSTAR